MKNEAAIQDIHVAVCNAVFELLGPAQEFHEARKPMLADEREMLGTLCGVVRECLQPRDMAVKSPYFDDLALQQQPQRRPL